MLVVPKAPTHVKSSLLSVLKSTEDSYWKHIKEKSEVSNSVLYIII